MQGMAEKGKKEKHEEQVQYAAYKQFCEDIEVEKKTAIKEAKEKIEMLKADIQKYEADASALAKEIAEHDEDISVWEGDIKAATKAPEISIRLHRHPSRRSKRRSPRPELRHRPQAVEEAEPGPGATRNHGDHGVLGLEARTRSRR